ncbi:MAG: hypothetical protein A3E80_02745 [Chlamydiae bacterium RIFCSPHIGHO2_12_FULL_49_9]|nr:MAG: hypothetical protein A3E80_02745 [Chlamydiae bacterium RIFCSPHIGHO2_12_FULL_49_9]
MYKLAICLLVAAQTVMCAEFHLKERLEKAKTGDYIVAEAGKMVTVLAIRSKNGKSVVFEEISAPCQNLKKHPASWADWVKARAPGHSSWSMIEIDLQTGDIVECYSFSKAAWVQLSRQESLFSTLLQLSLKPIPTDKLRRIGPPPQDGEADHRKIWAPPLVYEGKKIDNARFEAFETLWPEDSSELSNKTVSLYFDKDSRSPLPFWIQVETAHATAALRVIDAGKHLPSPYRTFPRRTPEFVGAVQKTENGIRLSLKSPKYFRQFELFAVDVTSRVKQITPITHSLVQGDEEFLTLEIDEDQLKQTLEPDHKYTWLLVPTGHTESYTESQRSFTWSEK